MKVSYIVLILFLILQFHDIKFSVFDITVS